MIPSAESLVILLQALVIPAIILFFYLDGMVIGKLTPPAALYVAYVVLMTPSGTVLLAVAALSTAAATLGQFTLYRGFNEESPEFVGIRRRVPHADRLPFILRERVGERRMQVVTRLFDRFGGGALVVTNTLPAIRSLMSIPAGLSAYPRGRFLLLSTVGNAVYIVLLTAIAWGLVDLARWVW